MSGRGRRREGRNMEGDTNMLHEGGGGRERGEREISRKRGSSGREGDEIEGDRG